MSGNKTRQMKFLIFSALFLIITYSCNKPSSGTKDLSGVWELTEVRGMMIIDSFPDDQKETLILKNDTYELRIGNTVTTGTYSTHPDPDVKKEVCLEIEPGIYTRRIEFKERSSDKKIYYELSGSTLKLISGCFAYDAGSEKIYKRKLLH